VIEYARGKIRVLIVEDSRVAQQLLVHILTADRVIEVVGVVDNGEEALAAVQRLRPDIVTMDIHMPKLDGYEATRAIMETQPTPIIIVSASTNVKDVASTFRAMEAGALAVLARPPGPNDPSYEQEAQALVQTVKLMSEIKLVKRTPRPKPAPTPHSIAPWSDPLNAANIHVVAIGASTGGPQVLHTILSGLRSDCGVPVLIVQHIAPKFVAGFVEWLSGSAHFPVSIASAGEALLPGHGYVAPDGFHLGVGGGPRIALSESPYENGVRPSADHLFHSVAEVFGPHAVGVLLTGMGKDGAVGLAELKRKGAITVVQDEASSVIFGMPGEAVKLGAASHVLPPEGIATLLAVMTRAKPATINRIDSGQR